MKTHIVKVKPQICDDVFCGELTFGPFRHALNFQVGDWVCFKAFDFDTNTIMTHPIDDRIYEITRLIRDRFPYNGCVALWWREAKKYLKEAEGICEDRDQKKTMAHLIKLELHLCDAVLSSEKPLEIRWNKRGYQVGELVRFIPVFCGMTVTHPIANRIYEVAYLAND